MTIKKISKVIPFGYKQTETESILEPVSGELEALDQAKKYLETCSYREVAEWLHRKTGRYISHVGLRQRIKRNITTKAKEDQDSQDEGETIS
jgi:hypothetical protein|tara:strand:+ start:279 stop:554 length:276 start_codon:yes stop_codon:yes gene_type:complete